MSSDQGQSRRSKSVCTSCSGSIFCLDLRISFSVRRYIFVILINSECCSADENCCHGPHQHHNRSFGVPDCSTCCWYTDSFQDRQVPLDESNTERSHRASRLLCHEDPLWSYAVLRSLSAGPLQSFVVLCGHFQCLVVMNSNIIFHLVPPNSNVLLFITSAIFES